MGFVVFFFFLSPSILGLEEDEILPVALEFLTQEDWKVINEAFSSNDNPLAGGEYKHELQKLFSLIVHIAPPPIGVGPAR